MIYDNGTVTEQASMLQTMKQKAAAYDEANKKFEMKSAFTQGLDHGVKSVEPVIDGLASELAKAHSMSQSMYKGY